MYPELFHVFGLTVHSFSLMMVIGFLCGLQATQYLAKRVGINPEHMVNACMIALIAGVVGARLSHVLENFDDYTRSDLSVWRNLFNAVNVSAGGLTFYGGFLLATPLCIAYGLWNKVNILRGMDVVAVGLMIGLGFGRIGCFLNGCCYGGQCELPWAVSYPYDSIAYKDEVLGGHIKAPPQFYVMRPSGQFDLMSPGEFVNNATLKTEATQQRSLDVHPAQLYSSATAFLIAGICFAFITLLPRAGSVFALMMMIEGPSRFILEMLRVEPPVMHVGHVGLSLSMVLGVIIGLAGAIMWFALRIFPDRDKTDTILVPAGTVA